MTDAAPEKRPTPRNQFSFSRLKTFHQCPARYRYRYLKGLKEAFCSVEAHLGKATHGVLEWLYEERRNGTDPGIDAALERFAHIWSETGDDDVAVVRVDDVADDYFRTGREMVEAFHSGAFQRDRSETVALELRFSLRLADDAVFTGFADRVGRTEAGRLFVIDYKTSRAEGNGSDFSEGLQAPLYAACALARYDEDEALAGYHYLRHGTTHWQRIDRRRSRQLTERFLGLTREALAATEFPARPGTLRACFGVNHISPPASAPDA